MRLPSIAATNLSEIPVPGEATPLREMHVTLAFLGNQVPMEQVFRSLACCYLVAQEYAPLELTAALLMSFPADPEGRIPVIARIVTPQLFDMRARLVQLLEMNKVEYSKRHPQYKPHVTLSYAQQAVPPQKIKPLRWPAQWLTVWGGDEADQLFSAEIELRGQKR
jgi:2'-5' RNA ligase